MIAKKKKFTCFTASLCYSSHRQPGPAIFRFLLDINF